MEQLTFRTATLDDAPAIVQLINSAFRPDANSKGWTSEAALVQGERINLEMVTKQIIEPKNVVLLGLINEKIIACVHIDGTSPEAYMGTFAVDASSQDKGVGRALGKYAEDYATQYLNACAFITLALEPRKEIIQLNLRLGYLPTGRIFPYPNKGIGTPIKKNIVMLEMRKLSSTKTQRALNIVFSHREEWEGMLTNAFKNTIHTIYFADFNEINVNDYDLAIPLRINALKQLCELNAPINNAIPVPSIQSINICDDKYQLNTVLIKKGFGKFIPKIRPPFNYPYILKKRIDEWGVNSHVINNADDENHFSDNLNSDDYFKQIYIPGKTQYATHILFVNNRILTSLSVKYTFNATHPIQGKDAPNKHEIFTTPFLVLFASILRSIGFNGLCCIDYKMINDHPFILEINPRLGASLCPHLPNFIKHVS
jgi:ribosomal protein S18 acetylase RimI-like enzyme